MVVTAAAIRLSATLDVQLDAPPLNLRAGVRNLVWPCFKGFTGISKGFGGLFGGCEGDFMQQIYSRVEIEIAKL